MTVPVQIPVTASTANGLTNVFPYGFKIAAAEDLAVTVDGIRMNSGYTVSGVGDPAGGNVTITVPPANGAKVVRYLAPILKRETDYQQFGDWMAAIVNLDIDRIWLVLQTLQQNDVRSLKLPVDTIVDQVLTQDATARANRTIKFDGAGNLTISTYDPDGAQTSAAASASAAATYSAEAQGFAEEANLYSTTAQEAAGNASTSEYNALAYANLAATSAVSVGFSIPDLQVQSKTAFTSGGTAPNFTVTTSPAYGGLAAGQRMRVKFHASGTTSNTLNRDGLGAKSLKQYDSTGSKVPAVISAGMLTDVEYDGTDMVVMAPLPEPLASTAEAQAGTDNTKAITPLRLREGLNASGSAPVYACRAWVNFNGTGTVAIRASGNVSSITDNGTGDYTVNFASAMPDVNYSVISGAQVAAGIQSRNNLVNSEPVSTTAIRLRIVSAADGMFSDQYFVCVSIFR